MPLDTPSHSRPPRNAPRQVPISLPLLGLLLLLATLIGGVGGVVLGASRPGSLASPIATITPTPAIASAPPTVHPSQAQDPPSTVEPTPPAPASLLPLSGRRIGLDPGHGPREDLGAVYLDPDTGKVALTEAEFNLDVALRLRDLLVERGASVVLTRDTNDTFTAPWPADANDDGDIGASADDLQTRIDILNDFGAEVFLSLHANSSARPGNHEDLQFLYCGASDCLFPTENKRLAALALTHLDAHLSEAGIPVDGGATIDDLTVDDSNQHMFLLGPANPPRHPRATAMPGIIGETFYVTLPSGAAHLLQEDTRQTIALAYADALQEFLVVNGN